MRLTTPPGGGVRTVHLSQESFEPSTSEEENLLALLRDSRGHKDFYHSSVTLSAFIKTNIWGEDLTPYLHFSLYRFCFPKNA